jgi:ribosomal protein S18 acetylase RimI-like enzyme
MSDILCWEALDLSAPEVERARLLYELTQPADERIPWAWIAGGVSRRLSWRPPAWSPHLLVASVDGEVAGFCCGMLHPGWGGYLSYIGTSPAYRGRGVASRLIELLVRVLRVDAAGTGDDVPFVVWESRPTRPEAWAARLRLFAKAGAMWLRGVTFYAERYDGGEGPVKLQLFVRPVASSSIDAAAVVRGLATRVYRMEEDHPFLLASLPGPDAELVPATDAAD